MSNLQYFEKPLETKNGNAVSCPFIKIKTKFGNTPIPQVKTLNGEIPDYTCVPNFQDSMLVPGFGMNVCNVSKPVHLNFNLRSDCYTDNLCENKMDVCYGPNIQG